MHTLCCQIQIDRLATLTEDRIHDLCRNLCDRIPHATHESGEDDGRYINLFVDSDDAFEVWRAIQASFLSDEITGNDIRAATIVTITGPNGWDDYLLLHHFDPTESLDTIDKAG